MKKKLLMMSMVMSIIVIASCHGIFYPKKVFYFTKTNDRPPTGAEARFKTKGEYPQELGLIFRRAGNSFENFMYFTVYVDKEYRKFKIHNMDISFDDEKIRIMENTALSLPESSSPDGVDPTLYYSKNGFYWTIYLNPIDQEKDLRYVKLYEVFKNKSVGDKFSATLDIVYSFDDETLKKDEIIYEIEVDRGSFTSDSMSY